jgi:hypothetical protein
MYMYIHGVLSYSAALLVSALLVGFLFLNKRTLTIDSGDSESDLSEGSGYVT